MGNRETRRTPAAATPCLTLLHTPTGLGSATTVSSCPAPKDGQGPHLCSARSCLPRALVTGLHFPPHSCWGLWTNMRICLNIVEVLGTQETPIYPRKPPKDSSTNLDPPTHPSYMEPLALKGQLVSPQEKPVCEKDSRTNRPGTTACVQQQSLQAHLHLPS